jgi:hypothetical protein
MNIESAQYIRDVDGTNIAVSAVIDGETLSIPLNIEGNRHWVALQEWAEKDGNEIAEAD